MRFKKIGEPPDPFIADVVQVLKPSHGKVGAAHLVLLKTLHVQGGCHNGPAILEDTSGFAQPVQIVGTPHLSFSDVSKIDPRTIFIEIDALSSERAVVIQPGQKLIQTRTQSSGL